MASHDKSFRAGETKGRTEERTNQMTESMKQKAEAAKDKTYEAAQGAKDKTYEAAQGAKEKSKQGAEALGQQAEAEKEKTEEKDHDGGLLQKTGEKMKNMAEAVKSSFGMASSGEDTGSAHEQQHKNASVPKGY